MRGKAKMIKEAFAGLIKPVTIRYPVGKWPGRKYSHVPAGLRGRPKIDGDTCTGCGACVAQCSAGAITISDGDDKRTVSIFTGQCIFCGRCEDICPFYAVQEFRVEGLFCRGCAVCTMICPVGAISMVRRKVGDIRIAKTEYGPLVWGKLSPGEAGTGKFINALRDVGGEVAIREGAELVIVDASAGIGCPLISSITGADLMLAVAEPTISGKSDLKRALKVAGHFGVRTLVCVNQYDLHKPTAREVERMGEDMGAEPIDRIPYDPEVVRATVEGLPVAAVSDGPAARAIKKVFGMVMEHLN